MNTKTIAILTSGGDAPGMNAVIRAVTRSAISKYKMRVIGIRRGYNGLMNGDVFEMNLRTVSDIVHKGGTMLYTARSLEFAEDAGVEQGAEVCRKLGITGIVVVGGDGSFRGARDLAAKGINTIGIPGTIDNDISCSDYSIGFDTAINTAMKMVDNIRDTAQSHDRCSVVEVMGKHAGHLALQTGLAVGATTILVPEIPYDLDKDVVQRMQFTQRTGKKHFIIVAAEGIGKKGATTNICNYIKDKAKIDTNLTILGYTQRGGSPTLKDRVIASRMGYRAVELLSSADNTDPAQRSRVIGVKANEIVDYEITEALNMKKSFDVDLYKIAHEISI